MHTDRKGEDTNEQKGKEERIICPFLFGAEVQVSCETADKQDENTAEGAHGKP